jgi:crotonobetainyl-CoA:carnitine CoA-transferase CaiB-like acyl-CoA transferase
LQHPPVPASERAAPLAGIRVISVEQYGAGPFGTLQLADLGAEIIKVEDPSTGGDVSRYIPPEQHGTESLFFEAFNRNKRSIALDLKAASGREVFERLVSTADAVFSNLRGDQATRLGLDYATLGRLNPAIVCVALTGYGGHGDSATRPGYDALVQAEAGWAAVTGGPGDPPTKSGLSLADYVGGLLAAMGLLVALREAERTGRGRDVETNLFDGATSMLSYVATWYLSSGFVAPRRGASSHPTVVPFQFFETKDGYIAVACAKEKFFQALAARLDLVEVAADPRFASFAARDLNREALLGILQPRFLTETTQVWLDRLAGAVPVASVRSLEEALDPAELSRRDMLASYRHPVLGEVRSVGSAIHLAGFTPTYRPGPALGADRLAILRELGYDGARADELAEAGAFGAPATAPRPALQAE